MASEATEIKTEQNPPAPFSAGPAPAAPPTKQSQPSQNAPLEARSEAPFPAHAQLEEGPKPADVHEKAKSRWTQEGLPKDFAGWVARAREVAETLAVDAVEREKANKTPYTEVGLMKAASLLKVLGPRKYGGGDQPWSTGYVQSCSRGGERRWVSRTVLRIKHIQ